MQRPEVLAPAGSGEALRAAARAGADAVYFGLSRFSARKRAENFADAALAGWVEELHLQGLRGYLTLNTLVFDDELAELDRAVGIVADAGVDAVIVQELGVLRLVHALAPSLPVHVSTQATVVSARELAAWERLGARRVVLARELELEAIARLRRLTSLELEVFVHGALCISYSGQCLASAAFGGRSANRGECAQPCRLPYRLGMASAGERCLSPCDLTSSALVPRLADLGVDALKIEGRLKGPEYVAAAVRLYRTAVDAWQRREAFDGGPAERAAALTFSRAARSGWLGGVDHLSLVDGGAPTHRGIPVGMARGVERLGRESWIRARLTDELGCGDGVRVAECGGRVWAIRLRQPGGWIEVKHGQADDEVRLWLGPESELVPLPRGARVYKTDDPRLAERLFGPKRPRVRLKLRLGGEPPRLAGEAEDGRRAEVPVEAPLGPAPHRSDWFSAKLGRLGDTPFQLEELVLELPPGRSPPASALNRARRALVERLCEQARRRHPCRALPLAELGARSTRPLPLPPGLFVLVRRLDQLAPALAAGIDGVYLELDSEAALAEACVLCHQARAQVGRVTPRIETSEPRGLADLWCVRTLGAFSVVAGPSVADATLHAANRLTVEELLGLGARAVTPAFEVDFHRLGEWVDQGLGPYLELVVYQHVPLFVTRHCLYAAHVARARDTSGCGQSCRRDTLRLIDRRGAEHRVGVGPDCVSTIFEGRARELSGWAELGSRGIGRLRVELLDESPQAVADLLHRVRGRATARPTR